jgi:hypothetical protein
MKTVTTLLTGLIGLAACAGPQATGTYQSNASYDKLYAASLAAVSSVGYSVTSASKVDGLIVAQQGVILGNGASAGLNATISKDAHARLLHVTFVAPFTSIAIGNFGDNMADYVNAVRTQVPDIRAYP